MVEVGSEGERRRADPLELLVRMVRVDGLGAVAVVVEAREAQLLEHQLEGEARALLHFRVFRTDPVGPARALEGGERDRDHEEEDRARDEHLGEREAATAAAETLDGHGVESGEREAGEGGAALAHQTTSPSKTTSRLRPRDSIQATLIVTRR